VPRGPPPGPPHAGEDARSAPSCSPARPTTPQRAARAGIGPTSDPKLLRLRRHPPQDPGEPPDSSCCHETSSSENTARTMIASPSDISIRPSVVLPPPRLLPRAGATFGLRCRGPRTWPPIPARRSNEGSNEEPSRGVRRRPVRRGGRRRRPRVACDHPSLAASQQTEDRRAWPAASAPAPNAGGKLFRLPSATLREVGTEKSRREERGERGGGPRKGLLSASSANSPVRSAAPRRLWREKPRWRWLAESSEPARHKPLPTIRRAQERALTAHQSGGARVSPARRNSLILFGSRSLKSKTPAEVFRGRSENASRGRGDPSPSSCPVSRNGLKYKADRDNSR
jgi:hypothetical protein